MYIYLTESNVVRELIPDFDPTFPGVSVHDRFAPDFVAKLIHVDDASGAEQGLVYDQDTGTFTDPIKN